jgi:hypothetical protein
VPARVFSTQFISQQGVTNTGVEYLVPAGFIAVVRDVILYTNTGISNTHCEVKNATSNALMVRHDAHTGNADWFHDELRQVLNSGEVLRAFTDGQQWDVTISGYLLVSP